MLKKTLGALVATTATTALLSFIALPANAAPIADRDSVGPLNGVTYTGFWSDNFSIGDANTNDNTAGSSSDDIYDTLGVFAWSDGAGNWSPNLDCLNADLSPASDATGDLVITCDKEVAFLPDIDSQVGARFFAEGDLLRFDHTLTNNSAEAFSYDWWSFNEFANAVKAQTIDENIATGFDLQKDENNEYVGVAFGLPSASAYPGEAGMRIYSNRDDETFIRGAAAAETSVPYFSLAAGESVTISVFVFHNSETSNVPYPSAAFDSLLLWATDTFDAFDGRLTRGFAAGTNVANWGVIASSPTPTQGPGTGTALASTGFDGATATLAGFAGLAALLAGLGVVVARRRKAGSNA